MAQKINPNLFNRTTQKKESKFINKKSLDHSVLIVNNLEIKAFIQKFFLTNNIIINNCKLLHFNNFFYIYVSYQQKIKNSNNNTLKFHKAQILKNFLKKKKIKIKKNIHVNKKIFNQNLNWARLYKRKNTYLKKYYEKSSINPTEICLFIKNFFNSLTNFKPNQFKFNIFLTLEKQNNKLVFLKKKEILLKRKQKLIILRRYKLNKFFNQGINSILATTNNKNSSKILANFIASQLKILNFHNLLIRFIKNTLLLLNRKSFLSKITSIKIIIKGRFNGNPRAKKKLIKINNLPPLQTKKSKIDYFENTAYTINSGTFGIKVWVYQT